MGKGRQTMTTMQTYSLKRGAGGCSARDTGVSGILESSSRDSGKDLQRVTWTFTRLLGSASNCYGQRITDTAFFMHHMSLGMLSRASSMGPGSRRIRSTR
jgi:hypothetical protein